jgi:hypothetical protein
MKRIDLWHGAQLLAKKKIEESNGTLMIATAYCEGQRTGEILVSFEDWLDEDIDADEVEETEAAMADPTPELNGSETLSTTRWPDSSTPSQDSVQAITGISK